MSPLGNGPGEEDSCGMVCPLPDISPVPSVIVPWDNHCCGGGVESEYVFSPAQKETPPLYTPMERLVYFLFFRSADNHCKPRLKGRMLAAFVNTVCGIWLLLPGSALNSTTSYRYLRLLTNETGYGLTHLFIGLLLLLAIHMRHARLLSCALTLHRFGWLFLAGIFLISNPVATGCPICFTIALLGADATIELTHQKQCTNQEQPHNDLDRHVQ
jgi:hypothetical protein